MEHIRGCHPRYPAPIDHVVVGSTALEYYKDEVNKYSFLPMKL